MSATLTAPLFNATLFAQHIEQAYSTIYERYHMNLTPDHIVVADDGLQASVHHVHPIGPVVRVELLHESEIVEVELSRERHEALQLAAGQTVWFRPRQMKVFNGGELLRSTPEKQPFLF